MYFLAEISGGNFSVNFVTFHVKCILFRPAYAVKIPEKYVFLMIFYGFFIKKSDNSPPFHY